MVQHVTIASLVEYRNSNTAAYKALDNFNARLTT
jgi:hypothetical protein